MMSVRINHASVYSVLPRLAAENLAALTGGLARPFIPARARGSVS